MYENLQAHLVPCIRIRGACNVEPDSLGLGSWVFGLSALRALSCLICSSPTAALPLTFQMSRWRRQPAPRCRVASSQYSLTIAVRSHGDTRSSFNGVTWAQQQKEKLVAKRLALLKPLKPPTCANAQHPSSLIYAPDRLAHRLHRSARGDLPNTAAQASRAIVLGYTRCW